MTRKPTVHFGAVTDIIVAGEASTATSSTSTSRTPNPNAAALWHNATQLQEIFDSDVKIADIRIAKKLQQMRTTGKTSTTTTAAGTMASLSVFYRRHQMRGLEFHLAVNAHRPRYAHAYVEAVVNKSRALQQSAAASSRSRNSNSGCSSTACRTINLLFGGGGQREPQEIPVEDQLQVFASKHSRANRDIAVIAAKLDRQEALMIYRTPTNNENQPPPFSTPLDASRSSSVLVPRNTCSMSCPNQSTNFIALTA